MSQKRNVTYTHEYPAGGKLPPGFDPDTMAVQMGNNVYTTGIYPVDSRTGAIPEGPEAQFDLAYDNMVDLLAKAGLTTDEIGLVTVFIPGPDYRNYINKGWLRVFPDEHNRPARKTNHVNLPEGVFIQLQVSAVAGGRRQRIEVEGLAHRDPLPNGVKIGDMVFSSVIVPQDLATAKSVEGPLEQIHKCFDNTKVFMEKAGSSLDDVLHLWTFMSDFKYQPDMVDIWVETWPADGDRPTRKTLRYPMGGLIQVQATGVVGGKRSNYEIPGVGHHDPIPMGAKVGNVFQSSGISGVEPDLPNGRRIESVQGLEPQIRWCEHGARSLLEQAGASLDDLAIMQILISDWAVIPVVKASWDKLFPDRSNRPALKFIDWRIPSGSHVQYHVTAVV